MPSRYSPYVEELKAQEDDARIKLMWGQVSRHGYGTNKVRARLKDLIEERDAQGLSEDERKKLAVKIITALDQVIQAEQLPLVEDRRAEELAQGMVTITRAERPDSTGRRWIKTQWRDGYSETVFYENDEEWAQHLQDEIHADAMAEDERRNVAFEGVPEDLRPLVGDVDALFAHIHEQQEGESFSEMSERVQRELKVLKRAMRPVDYERLSALAWEGER